MASRIVGHNLEPHHLPSTADLRHAFEAAVCEIYQVELPAAKRLQYHAPIVPRAKVLGISQSNAEKRALADAARALAQLWKI
jgi:hypothetical protein